MNSILLVEDDNITNFINERLLKQIDVAPEVLVSQNGQEALNLINKRLDNDKSCPEIILLDLKMPVMDGFEFLEEFNELSFEGKKEVQIIILTTSTNHKDLERINSLGYNNVINKPLTKENLLPVLENVLEQKTA